MASKSLDLASPLTESPEDKLANLPKLGLKTPSKDEIKQKLVDRFLTPPTQIPYHWLTDWQTYIIIIQVITMAIIMHCLTQAMAIFTGST